MKANCLTPISMTPTLNLIRERLSAYNVHHHIDAAGHRAAVAVILREVDRQTEILFIKRADKDGDPWSGHMAFPGGHIDPGDATAQQAAERETLEEIGLDLTRHGQLVGTLEPEPPVIRVPGTSMMVAPFVYEIDREPGQYDLNHEVAELHWSKIGPMLQHENLTSIDLNLGGQSRTMPGFDVNGRIVWGMTFRMLNRLLIAIDPDFEPID